MQPARIGPRRECGLVRGPWDAVGKLDCAARSEGSKESKQPFGSNRKPPWKSLPIALGGIAAGLIALGVIVITIRDKNGRETKLVVPDDSKIVVVGPSENVQIRDSLHRPQQPADTDDRNSTSSITGIQSLPKPQSSTSDKNAIAAFKPLFNGKDKTGWMDSPMNRGEWTVVGGLLQGRGSGERGIAATLVTERKDFANFRLRAKFRYPQDGGGGIEVRYNYDGENTARSSYPVSHGVWPSNRDWVHAPGKITKLLVSPTALAGCTLDRPHPFPSPRISGIPSKSRL